MRCEVVAVGTELLLGQIVDTNSSWIGEQLALAGIDSHFQTKVGDNRDRIASSLRQALERSDAVVVCGGLGPTQDDITRDVIAEVMGVELLHDEAIEARIRAMFGSRGRAMSANNLRQAQVPAGATTIPQMPGTAPGLVCPMPPGHAHEGKVIYAVPGVPAEMREMVAGTVVPDLQRRAGVTSVIASRTLRTWGQSESGLAEMLHDEIERLDREPGATIAFLASGIEGIKVRLTAKAATAAEAEEVIAAEEAVVRSIIGDIVFGVDDETMEHAVVSLLAEQGLTLAVAESVTGGLIGSRITNVPGASKVFRGGVVAYASDVKFSVLGVPEGPVVTEECARAMADGVRKVLGADVGLGVTGVAGPDAQEDLPPGTVFFGLAIGDRVESRPVRMPGDRERIRAFSTIGLLNWLRRRLLDLE
ncbi:competence/damage-inducible protein A [Actinomarinicola tropica]|uniref:CinA-like protein n=1 Tax=Actinomarinicola tropica TaxID=2789776 RepID=A0A5Q2RNY9_9ACTN|nr:competence/damage-inducible protein A [Actinomarinicola tropica]QGG94915.1 competence/damage-inducible protein A [Actinomarinicola tropica]